MFYRAGTTGWTDFYQRPTALWVAMPSYADWLPLSALPARFPQATAEADDPDADGMSNRAEMLAGTDPTDPLSTLSFESVPRPGDLTDADRTPLGAMQHAVYVRTTPGKTYGVQWADALDGTWRLDAVVTATTTQKRFVFDKPQGNRFYRVTLAQ